MLLMLMAISSVLLLGIVFLRFRTDVETLTQSRKVLFLIGSIGSAMSTAVILIFLLHAHRVAHRTTPVDLDRMYPVLWMLGFAVLAAFLALFGGRLSRLLLFASGIITFIAWYLAALAVSP
jgi:fumarate reductase subunit D